MSRLGVHLDELARIIDTGGAARKRLDFLMQELNREANTLGSKGANVDLANAAIELKLLIEEIREQVQNIEQGVMPRHIGALGAAPASPTATLI